MRAVARLDELDECYKTFGGRDDWNDKDWQNVQDLVHEALDAEGNYDYGYLEAYLEGSGYSLSASFDDMKKLQEYIEKNEIREGICAKRILISITQKKLLLIIPNIEKPTLH